MHFHAPAYSPHLRYIRVAQHPVALDRVADIHHTTGLRLQAFGGVVGQFGQGFGVSDADTDRDARAAQYLATDLAAEAVQVIDAGEVDEGFVDVKERL